MRLSASMYCIFYCEKLKVAFLSFALYRCAKYLVPVRGMEPGGGILYRWLNNENNWIGLRFTKR